MAQFRVVVVGHDVYVVGLGLFDVGALHDGNQVCAVLERNQKRLLDYESTSGLLIPTVALLAGNSPAEKLLQ